MTVSAVEAARRRGVIRDGDEVVALLTGNGVKTPDARRFGADEESRPGADRRNLRGLRRPVRRLSRPSGGGERPASARA